MYQGLDQLQTEYSDWILLVELEYNLHSFLAIRVLRDGQWLISVEESHQIPTLECVARPFEKLVATPSRLERGREMDEIVEEVTARVDGGHIVRVGLSVG